MESFDTPARAATPDGPITATGSSRVDDLVHEVVERCGYQVMIDVAWQYPNPTYIDLVEAAGFALGSLGFEPAGLRCADLQSVGYSSKQAVDYWFLWGSPELMDADLDGIPCETVYGDVARYMPAYY